MFVYLIAAAGVVTLGATVYAWLTDNQTAAQHERNATLRAARDALKTAFEAESDNRTVSEADAARNFALATKAILKRACQENLDECASLHHELPLLQQNLQSRLKQPHLSAFRRHALRILQTRIEDAIARLDAFSTYCQWYDAQLDRLEQAAEFEALANFTLPEAGVPGDWFYVGKVGLVDRDELNARPNRFDQVIQLTQVKTESGYVADVLELTLAQTFPDQKGIPVQLIRTSTTGIYFSASVLRGALYTEHILKNEPCRAVVERVDGGQQGYQVRCYPEFHGLHRDNSLQGGVIARLARNETLFPGKAYQPGNVVDVYPLYHDLLLTSRRGRDQEMLTVTERFDSLNLEQEWAAPVYLCLDHGLPNLDSVAETLENGAPWSLRTCSELELGRLLIEFQIGGWLIRTTSDAHAGFLAVQEIKPEDIHAIDQTALPFELQLIERGYLGDVFIDAERCQHLRNFCLQERLYEQRGHERERAWEFFARWMRVAEYLLDIDGHLTIGLGEEFQRNDRLLVQIDINAEAQMQALNAQAEKELARGRRTQIALEMACIKPDGAEGWVQVADLSMPPENAGGLYVMQNSEGEQASRVKSHGFTPILPMQRRLRARKGGSFQNLQRQKQALEAFALDKILNKSIKQILVDPASYAGQADGHWQRKARAGLSWHDPNWREEGSSPSSKRVIEAALIESNLYLMQGPPGTGKTTCIVELLHQLYVDNPTLRILVVSQQNAAVDNAVQRFLTASPQFGKHVLRIGKPDKIDEAIRHYGIESRLQNYFEGRVAAFQHAAAKDGMGPPLLQDWLASVRDEHQQFDQELAELLIGEYQLVGATCVGLAGQQHGIHRLHFDVAIIDEAGRSTVPEMLIPILRARKVILIGDHFQLPPTIAATLREKDSVDALPFLETVFLKETFFEVMYRSLPATCRGRLDHQFRMVEPIGDLVADLFYQIDGQRGLFNSEPHDRTNFLDAMSPLWWYDIRGKQDEEGTSKSNRAEASAIIEWLTAASEQLRKRGLQKDVAIITPYGAQKRLIHQLLDHARGSRGKDKEVRMLGENLSVRVDTVDSFQGSEAAIVLYSTVRTAGEISFIVDRQRLNVACSRAKETLVFFGHADFLRKAEAHSQKPPTERLFGWIMQRAKFKAAGKPAEKSHQHSDKNRTRAKRQTV